MKRFEARMVIQTVCIVASTSGFGNGCHVTTLQLEMLIWKNKLLANADVDYTTLAPPCAVKISTHLVRGVCRSLLDRDAELNMMEHF